MEPRVKVAVMMSGGSFEKIAYDVRVDFKSRGIGISTDEGHFCGTAS